MTNIIEQEFKYGTNSIPNSLWGSMGYTYGKCSRQLHYNNKFGKVGFTQQDINMMKRGTEIHTVVESYLKNIWSNFDIENEVKKSFDIVLPDGTRFIIGAKPDLLIHFTDNDEGLQKILIEIKYIYSRSAYYQTLIERLVFPEFRVMCFQYGNLNKPQFAKNIIIPLKADYEMSIVYAGRIITALYHLPPRFPLAHVNHPVCNKCIHKEVCYLTPDLDIGQQHDAWNEFKSFSQPYIDSIREQAQI